MPTASRRPTSASVAALAGVSRTTVSFVMNERADISIPPATRQRVLDAARSLGYMPNIPARRLAGGRSQVLGMTLRAEAGGDAVDDLQAAIVKGIAAAAQAAGYSLVVENPAPSGAGNARLLRSAFLDGVVVLSARTDDPELLELFRDGFPIVVHRSMPGLPAPTVDVDDFAGSISAVEHLIFLGRTRIACIANEPLVDSAVAERLAGYRTALQHAGIGFDPDLVIEGGAGPEGGHQAMTALLEGQVPFDGVLAASDAIAFGAIGALREKGLRIPEDVSVVGFGDIPLAAYCDPPLTTVHVPAYDVGLAAGRALIDRIERRPVEPRLLLPTNLVVRASTAPAGRFEARRPSPGRGA